tara:strand:- start:17751 stop:17978 length:228 start_codon:yes stop_codon:yes gene_type:complete
MRDHKKPTNVRARTANPNTPETDKQLLVMHVVNYTIEDKEYEISLPAECPMSAIELFHRNYIVATDEHICPTHAS